LNPSSKNMISISNYCGCELGHALLVPSLFLHKLLWKKWKINYIQAKERCTG